MKIFLKILSVLGILAWCACFALGYNYKQGGALVVSILLAVGLLVAMVVLIYLMNRWGNPEGSEHKANARTKEIICGVLYAAVVVLSLSGVAQFVTVQSSVQNEVRPEAEKRINELENVFGDESIAGSYQSYVEAKKQVYAVEVAAKFSNLGESAKQENVDLEVSRLEDELTKEGQFGDLQADVDDFLNHCRYSVRHWVPWTITRYLADLDNNLTEWEKEVISMSEECEYTKVESYTVDSVCKGNLLELVENPEGGVFSGLAIIVITVLQAVILFFYFAGKDWSRKGPRRYRTKSNPGIFTYHGNED